MIDSDTISYVSDPGGLDKPQDGAPYLVLAMESQRPLEPAARFSLAGVDVVSIGRAPERTHQRFREGGKGYLQILLPDAWMSAEHARLVREVDGWRLEDRDSKNGTFLNGARTPGARLRDSDLIEAGSAVFLFHTANPIGVKEPAVLSSSDFAGQPTALATLSPRLRRDLRPLPKIAGSGVPILILGDTGTGKEVVARTIHELSGRSGPFTAVNCGALPDTLIESELFGAKKGAFSGATEDREGLVRAADRGTLFLDEIAELPESSQTALLRVLQESEVLPIGGTRPVAVDIRVLAATHQDLEARVEAGQFRRDLYSRLIGYQLQLPPLRERREDIGLIAAHLLERIAGDRASELRFRRAAARALFTCPWPLNIRELEHALSSAIALAEDGDIALEHLPASVRERDPTRTEKDRPRLSEQDEQLRARLIDLLQQHGGNVSAVAREMDKERVQIRRWAKRLGIDLGEFR